MSFSLRGTKTAIVNFYIQACPRDPGAKKNCYCEFLHPGLSAGSRGEKNLLLRKFLRPAACPRDPVTKKNPAIAGFLFWIASIEIEGLERDPKH
jgi:hypothetical protein